MPKVIPKKIDIPNEGGENIKIDSARLIELKSCLALVMNLIDYEDKSESFLSARVRRFLRFFSSTAALKSSLKVGNFTGLDTHEPLSC